MSQLMARPPFSAVEPVTEVMHGVSIADPYRWLEKQNSPQTRAWIENQNRYARTYLDEIPGRERIRDRVRELVDVESFDSFLTSGTRYFFRRRLRGREQPSIYFREGPDGQDELLIDPALRGTGTFTAVKPLSVSPSGKLLLYEVKEGGERTGTCELLEIETRKRLSDGLPRGYLRGFAFTPNDTGFFYSHEAVDSKRPFYRAIYEHLLGTSVDQDREIFCAGEGARIRLCLLADNTRLVFVVYRFLEKKLTDIYVTPLEGTGTTKPVFREIEYGLSLRLLRDKILALTDRDAPNRRIVEICLKPNGEQDWVEIIRESDARITSWAVAGDSILVSYMEQMIQHTLVFDLCGNKTAEFPLTGGETVRIICASTESDELLLESESFADPICISRYSLKRQTSALWARRTIPFNGSDYTHSRVLYAAKDGTSVPMFLVGRRETLEKNGNPTIMTSYGGYGLSMTPQFSTFVACFLERGCVFALPNIRGGSEFGEQWRNAARRRNRQTAYDDFLSAAEWLLATGRTAPGKLAIFGGSNSGLLVGAAMTKRPDLFRAVLCLVHLLDMLRYHLFDKA